MNIYSWGFFQRSSTRDLICMLEGDNQVWRSPGSTLTFQNPAVVQKESENKKENTRGYDWL